MKSPFARYAAAGLLLTLLLAGCQAPADEPAPDALAPPQVQDAEPETVPEVADPTPQPQPEPTAIEAFSSGSSNALWEPITGQLGDLSMVYVPAGCFLMGSTEEHIAEMSILCNEIYSSAPFPCDTTQYAGETPQHEVCVDGFWIGQTEITNAQYKVCVDAGACEPPLDRTYYDDPAYADHPVIQVTWSAAAAFVEWAGGMLPSEAQWEYAARGPESWIYPWGNTFDPQRLNYCDVNCDVYFWADSEYNDGYALTAPVGSFPSGASWVGALDLSGNAWEWTSSQFVAYPYDPADGREALDSAGDHVLRGGCFDVSYIDERAMFRYRLPPEGVCRGYGFRIAAPPDAVQ